MMEIIGGRINSVEAKRGQPNAISSFDMSISIDALRVSAKSVEVDYGYLVTYGNDSGVVLLRGTLMIKDERKQLQKVRDGWAREKRLPQEYAALLATTIPRVGMANALLATKILDLPPPLPPFHIEAPAKQG